MRRSVIFAVVIAVAGLGSGEAWAETQKPPGLMKTTAQGRHLNEATRVVPRDAASGLPTGKRMHKPVMLTTESKRSGKSKFKEFTIKKTTDSASPR